MDSLELTKKLISFNTINPPGNERICADFISEILMDIGFEIQYFDFAPGRTTILAKIPGCIEKNAICFTGHMDVVPLGKTDWSCDPFSGEIQDGKIFGRGSSDMKSGVAAMICMAHELREDKELLKKIVFIFTAGEETCSQGAYYLANLEKVLKKVKAMVVAEPTSNVPIIGHKGCVRFEISIKGVTAHAAMPELGINAIYKAADIVKKLENFDFKTEAHSLLGSPTLVVSQISGGMNINSVPDKTTIGIDIRTIPGQSFAKIQEDLQKELGDDVEIKLLEKVNSVITEDDNEWIQQVYSIMENISGSICENRAGTYFTDASVLKPACGNPPCIILGPGESGMAHKTDEFCYIDKIEEAVKAYAKIVKQI